ESYVLPDDPLRLERYALDRLAVVGVCRRACLDRGGQLLLQVAPGYPFDLDRYVRVRLLVLRGRLIEHRESLRLRLGLPQADHLLVVRIGPDGDGADEGEPGERGGESAGSYHRTHP